ncbi:MAG: FtsX-like permease family protein [Bacilli bacterium]|nr:FtsX-like permease family protein [Bacilli bacterium]
MSILTIVVGVLGINICASATKSINDYIKASNLPDRIYTTKMLSTSEKEELLSIDGVESVNTRFVSSGTFEIETDGVFSGYIISYNNKDLNKVTFLEEAEVPKNAIKSYLPTGFAKRHNVKAGDKMTVTVKGVKLDTRIKAIISSPETMFGDKDFMSMHEGYSYSNLYVDISDIEKVLSIPNLANQWLLYLKSDLNNNDKKQVISQIDEAFGVENIVSTRDFEGMKNSLLSYKSNLGSVEKLGYFFAILIVLITLGLNFVFIQIIVKKEKRTIGLLKALGYKKKNIVRLFSIFTLLINIPAIIVGFPLGYLVLKITLLKMEASFFMPLGAISISPISVICLLVITLSIGFISSLMATSQISKVEPCDIYAKNEEIGREPIKLFKCFKGNKFTKISITSMMRSLGRQIVGSLCISACILFMFVSIEGYASNSKVRAGGYGDRFTYDFVIRSINDTSYQDIKDNIKSIDVIEPYIFIDGETNFGSKKIAAIKDGNTLTTLRDSKNKVLLPGNGVIIDQFTAKANNLKEGDSILIFSQEFKISGVSIQYINAVTYISFDTAAQLGFNTINGAMVKLKSGASTKQFTKDVNNLNNEIYVVKMADQQAYLGERYTPIAVALIFLGTLSFLIGCILIINTAFMDFLELKAKYATLRAMGTPIKKIMQISLFENILRCVVGFIVALPLCYLSATLLFKLLTSSFAYYTMINFFGCFLISSAACIIYIVIGVLMTFFSIKKLDFSHYLNNRE